VTYVPAHLPRPERRCTRVRLAGGPELLDGLEAEMDGFSEEVLVIVAVPDEGGDVEVGRHVYRLGPEFGVDRHQADGGKPPGGRPVSFE
jgi:hypothetical protein